MADIVTGLDQYWPLQIGDGTTTVPADVGSDGTIVGWTATEDALAIGPGGQMPVSYSIPTSTEYIDGVTANYADGVAFSCALFLNFNASVSHFIGRASGDFSRSIRKASDTTITLQFAGTGGGQTTFTVPSLGTGIWHHIAVTRNTSNEARVYSDGVESSSGMQSRGGSFDPTQLGRRGSGSMAGYVCDYRTYNRVLASEDVVALAAQSTMSGMPVPQVIFI
jgi:Concanavalin A-like lectin/glucanases superfamily